MSDNRGDSKGDGNPRRRERIRWHCRRGMLELDLALQRFMDRHLATLEEHDLDVFERLLAMPDNELLDLVLCRVEPTEEVERVARMLQGS